MCKASQDELILKEACCISKWVIDEFKEGLLMVDWQQMCKDCYEGLKTGQGRCIGGERLYFQSMQSRERQEQGWCDVWKPARWFDNSIHEQERFGYAEDSLSHSSVDCILRYSGCVWSRLYSRLFCYQDMHWYIGVQTTSDCSVLKQ